MIKNRILAIKFYFIEKFSGIKFFFSKKGFNEFRNINRNFFYFLNKNLYLLFSSIFKSLRTYVYVFIIPLTLLSLIFAYETYGGLNQPLPPIVAGYLLIPGFSLILLLTNLINEWKNSIFLKRIHTLGTSKNQFLISLWIVSFILGWMSIIFCTTCITLMVPLINGYIVNPYLQMFAFFNFGSAGQVCAAWFGVICGASIVILGSIGIATVLAGSISNAAVSQSLAILIVIAKFCFIWFIIIARYTSKKSNSNYL